MRTSNIYWTCRTCGGQVPVEHLACPRCEPPAAPKATSRLPTFCRVFALMGLALMVLASFRGMGARGTQGSEWSGLVAFVQWVLFLTIGLAIVGNAIVLDWVWKAVGSHRQALRYAGRAIAAFALVANAVGIPLVTLPRGIAWPRLLLSPFAPLLIQAVVFAYYSGSIVLGRVPKNQF